MLLGFGGKGYQSMKVGDMVTIKEIEFTRIEGPLGAGKDSDFKEMGIILEITQILGNTYASVWWFTYDTTFKGKPSGIIPCQYLRVI